MTFLHSLAFPILLINWVLVANGQRESDCAPLICRVVNTTDFWSNCRQDLNETAVLEAEGRTLTTESYVRFLKKQAGANAKRFVSDDFTTLDAPLKRLYYTTLCHDALDQENCEKLKINVNKFTFGEEKTLPKYFCGQVFTYMGGLRDDTFCEQNIKKTRDGVAKAELNRENVFDFFCQQSNGAMQQTDFINQRLPIKGMFMEIEKRFDSVDGTIPVTELVGKELEVTRKFCAKVNMFMFVRNHLTNNYQCPNLVQPSPGPSNKPSLVPSDIPSNEPALTPSHEPSTEPARSPSTEPSVMPSFQPSLDPSVSPSIEPSSKPSEEPSAEPSFVPSNEPSIQPSAQPSSEPSIQPSFEPSVQPSPELSVQPSFGPSTRPSRHPSDKPSEIPSSNPSYEPSTLPSLEPSPQPSSEPSAIQLPFSSQVVYNLQYYGDGNIKGLLKSVTEEVIPEVLQSATNQVLDQDGEDWNFTLNISLFPDTEFEDCALGELCLLIATFVNIVPPEDELLTDDQEREISRIVAEEVKLSAEDGKIRDTLNSLTSSPSFIPSKSPSSLPSSEPSLKPSTTPEVINVEVVYIMADIPEGSKEALENITSVITHETLECEPTHKVSTFDNRDLAEKKIGHDDILNWDWTQTTKLGSHVYQDHSVIEPLDDDRDCLQTHSIEVTIDLSDAVCSSTETCHFVATLIEIYPKPGRYDRDAVAIKVSDAVKEAAESGRIVEHLL